MGLWNRRLQVRDRRRRREVDKEEDDSGTENTGAEREIFEGTRGNGRTRVRKSWE